MRHLLKTIYITAGFTSGCANTLDGQTLIIDNFGHNVAFPNATKAIKTNTERYCRLEPEERFYWLRRLNQDLHEQGVSLNITCPGEPLYPEWIMESAD